MLLLCDIMHGNSVVVSGILPGFYNRNNQANEVNNLLVVCVVIQKSLFFLIVKVQTQVNILVRVSYTLTLMM